MADVFGGKVVPYPLKGLSMRFINVKNLCGFIAAVSVVMTGITLGMTEPETDGRLWWAMLTACLIGLATIISAFLITNFAENK